jgi:hypothetical protein
LVGCLQLQRKFDQARPVQMMTSSSHRTSSHRTSSHLISPHLTSPPLTSPHLISSHPRGAARPGRIRLRPPRGVCPPPSSLPPNSLLFASHRPPCGLLTPPTQYPAGSYTLSSQFPRKQFSATVCPASPRLSIIISISSQHLISSHLSSSSQHRISSHQHQQFSTTVRPASPRPTLCIIISTTSHLTSSPHLISTSASQHRISSSHLSAAVRRAMRVPRGPCARVHSGAPAQRRRRRQQR